MRPDISLPRSGRLATAQYHISWVRRSHYTAWLSKYFTSISMLSSFYSLISLSEFWNRTMHMFIMSSMSVTYPADLTTLLIFDDDCVYIYIYISTVQSSVVNMCTAYCNIKIPPFCPHSVSVFHIILSTNSYYFPEQH